MSEIRAYFQGPIEDFQLEAEFVIPSKGVTAIFGKSGCGKTTVLRCLAGLHKIDNGKLSVDGEVWQNEITFIPAHKRPIGYVFQEANLFEHMNVKENLSFGMRRLKQVSGPSFDEVVDLLGLDGLLDRSPRNLSGGEKQRVAIGRALLNGPRLLLMDEPLSALDRMSKDEIIPYLEKLHDNLSIPVVIISHDTDEVERLADHLILMEDGRVKASGPLIDMLADPTLYLAQSSKTASLLEVKVRAFSEEDQMSEVVLAGKPLFVSGYVGEVGAIHRIRLAARDISLATEKPSRTTIVNIMKGRIDTIHPLGGGRVNVVVSLDDDRCNNIIARITTRSLRTFDLKRGQSVYAQIKGVSMIERKR